MLIDLHVLIHDGDTDALLETIPATLVDALCLVDLGKLPDAAVVEAARTHGKKVFVGAQIALEKGHILVYPPAEDTDLAPLLSGGDDDKLRALLEAGCALLACHPFDKETDFGLGDWLVQFTALHGALAVTASSAPTANDMTLEVVENLDIAAAGGTGSDGPLGKAATLFASTVATQSELVEEIKRGDCWAVALGEEDRWTSVARRSDRHRGGGRDSRGRGGRERGGRGGRGRGDRDRGGQGRSRGRGDRNRNRPNQGESQRESQGESQGENRVESKPESKGGSRGKGGGADRGESRGNRPEKTGGQGEANGNVIDETSPPEIDGNR